METASFLLSRHPDCSELRQIQLWNLCPHSRGTDDSGSLAQPNIEGSWLPGRWAGEAKLWDN